MAKLESLTGALLWVSGACLFAIIAVTMCDVLANNLLKRPIRGTFEVVELLLVTVIFTGLPEIFRQQLNIVVDVVDHFVSPTMRSRLIMLGLVVTLAFLCVLGYAMINPALDTVRYPERRQDSGVRTSVFWIPVLIGHALCIAVTATDLYRRFSPSHAGEQL